MKTPLMACSRVLPVFRVAQAHAGDGILADDLLDRRIERDRDVAVRCGLVPQLLLGVETLAAVKDRDARGVGGPARSASSRAELPPPTTQTSCPLKNAPSQAAQCDTPRPMSFCSPAHPERTQRRAGGDDHRPRAQALARAADDVVGAAGFDPLRWCRA